MKIGIIDAELIGKKKHRFPNLACMKISGHYKENGNDVELVLNYDNLHNYNLVYISKVFTNTEIPNENYITSMDHVECGGTGFYYDKAPPLPPEIEHHMPDYHLYDDWVNQKLENGGKRKDFEYYLDHSIGYLTRKCFRGCSFCVNKNYKKVEYASPLKEFLDVSRKYICLLDDNFLGYRDWKVLLEELQNINKRFQFKQGLDERILNDEKTKMLVESKYYGDYIFAFDNIEDKDIIIEKLKIWRKYYTTTAQTTKFYIFCGFDRNDVYDEKFWKQDIIDTFERVKILMQYGCLPYIMRHENYNNSPYRGIYITLARWCNQPSFFKKQSLNQYVYIADGKGKEDKMYASKRYLEDLKKDCPEIAKDYFDLRFEDLNQYSIK